MIWGSQYDAMMNWMAKTGKTVGSSTISTGTRNQSYVTGNANNGEYNDVLNKIYDLYGCHFEWTLEANGTYNREVRGGFSDYETIPAQCNDSNANSTNDYDGSRLSLYIVD